VEKRIETSLYAKWEKIRLLLDDMDEWIVDIKDTNPSIYKAYTGKRNTEVLKNLMQLKKYVPSERIRIRVPHIKNFNEPEDVKRSIIFLEKIGYSRIDEFEYVIV